MSLILNIETATTVCSVALFNGATLLAARELDAGYTHAENLHVFMMEVLKEAAAKASDLKAIAVSKGPGSYTGLRIGSSSAKGLAYALNIPLISVDTLKVMVQAALTKNQSYTHYIPLIDARRMEVYSAVYNKELMRLNNISALIITEEQTAAFGELENPCFFGEGMPKCRSLLEKVPGAAFIDGVIPSARFMGPLSLKKYKNNEFQDVAYFEPFYLKEFIAGRKKGGI